MNRKIGQIDQISCFLPNKKNITNITSWNRNSSDETIKTSRNLLEAAVQSFKNSSLSPNHELLLFYPLLVVELLQLCPYLVSQMSDSLPKES